MAVKKKKKKVAKKGRVTKKKGPVELIISKSRVKAQVKDCNISKEFYEALDAKVREMIGCAEERADGNKRRTLRPWDL